MTTTKRQWYQAPSGRLHTLQSCSGGAPKARMLKVPAPTPVEAQALLTAERRPDICRCAWRSAQRIVDDALRTPDSFIAHAEAIQAPRREQLAEYAQTVKEMCDLGIKPTTKSIAQYRAVTNNTQREES
jgi:hypothetical protein